MLSGRRLERRVQGRRRGQHVTDAAARLDERRRAGDVDLLSERVYGGVDDVAHDLGVLVVKVSFDLGARNDFALAQGEVLEQAVLARGHLDLMAGAGDGA